MSYINPFELTAFLETLADEAALITRHYFRRRLDVQRKDDETPVTIADRQTEMRLRTLINVRYPEHGIVGEEEPEIVGNSEFKWVIDPIDGTRSFISGLPLYGTLISVLHQNIVLASIVDMPILNERWLATKDGMTLFNGSPTRSANTTLLSRAKMMATDPQMFKRDEWNKVLGVMHKVEQTRFTGDCYIYGMLANGWIDVVIESDLKPYDFIPLKLIVEQAGGIITDWQGEPLNMKSSGQIVASANTVLHRQVLSLLA